MEPLSKAFNVAVMAMANRLMPMGYDIAENAPSTLEKLQAHVAETGRICVWNGASDKTIFAYPEHNWAFRAWQDWCHYKHNLEFNEAGKRKACDMQKQHIQKYYGYGPQSQLFCDLLEFEIMGQFEYKKVFGNFPEDQMALAIALGIGKPKATSSYLNKRLRSFAQAKTDLGIFEGYGEFEPECWPDCDDPHCPYTHN